MPPLTIGLAQTATSTVGLSTTLNCLERLTSSAAQKGIQILLFPEAYLGGYPRGSSFGCVVGSRTQAGREEYYRYWKECVDLGVGADGVTIGTGKGDGTRGHLEKVSRETGVFLVVGCVERAGVGLTGRGGAGGKPGGTLYCSVVFVDPKLGVVGHRRKLMPTASERLVWGTGSPTPIVPTKESPSTYTGLKAIDATFGSSNTVSSSPGSASPGLSSDPLLSTSPPHPPDEPPATKVTLSATICWENYMPLLRYAYYQQGVQIYFAPTADGRETWISTMQHIACEGRCFVVSCNQYVPSPAPVEQGAEGDGAKAEAEERKNNINPGCRGGSCIISPLGEILAGPLWDVEGILSYTIEDVARSCVEGKMDFDVVGHYSGPVVHDAGEEKKKGSGFVFGWS